MILPSLVHYRKPKLFNKESDQFIIDFYHDRQIYSHFSIINFL